MCFKNMLYEDHENKNYTNSNIKFTQVITSVTQFDFLKRL